MYLLRYKDICMIYLIQKNISFIGEVIWMVSKKECFFYTKLAR